MKNFSYELFLDKLKLLQEIESCNRLIVQKIN